MAEPFRPAVPKGGFTRSLRSKRAATFEAIEGVLAACNRLSDVTVRQVDDVCSAQGVDLGSRFASDRKHLYRRYLAHCLEDKVLSSEESEDLEHLQILLRLSTADVASLHDEVAHEVYGRAVAEVLEDLEISPEEDTFLRRLRGELQLSETVAADMLARGQRRARDTALREASALDPEFTVQRAPAGEFVGRSSESFDDAVADALSKALIAIPTLHWFEVSSISGYVGAGNPHGWHVTVRGGIKTS